MAGLTQFGEAEDHSKVNGIMHGLVDPVGAHVAGIAPAQSGPYEQVTGGWMDSHPHRFSEDPATNPPLLGFDDPAALEHDIYDAGVPRPGFSAGMHSQVGPRLAP